MPRQPKRLSDLKGRRARDRDYARRRKLDPDQARADRLRTSGRWKRVRALKLAQDPLCEDCRERGVVRPAAQVHHLEPVVRRPELAFVMENLRSLCVPCHARREAGEGAPATGGVG